MITATTTATATASAAAAVAAKNVALTAKSASPAMATSAAAVSSDYLMLQQQQQQFNSHYYQQQQQLAPSSVALNASHQQQQQQHSHLHSHAHPVGSSAAAASTSFATFNGNSSLNSNLANGSSRSHSHSLSKKFNCNDPVAAAAVDPHASDGQPAAPPPLTAPSGNGDGEGVYGILPPLHKIAPPIGLPPPAIKKSATTASLHASREDVASLGGNSSVNSQVSGHNHYMTNGDVNGTTVPSGRPPGLPNSILKGSKGESGSQIYTNYSFN